MTEIIWSPQSLRDLGAIRADIALDWCAYRQAMVRRIVADVERLRVSPESGRIAPEEDDLEPAARKVQNLVMTNALLEDILRLSVEERVELIDEIWESIAASPEAIPVTQAQRDELDRRLEARANEPHAGRPWREVIARLKKQA